MDEHMEEELLQDIVPEESKGEGRKKRLGMSKMTYYALILIFIAVFILSGVYLGGYFLETNRASDDYDALASIYQQATGSQSNASSGSEASAPQGTQPPTILLELQSIYDLNNDFVGYLNFPYDDLNLQYPAILSYISIKIFNCC